MNLRKKKILSQKESKIIQDKNLPFLVMISLVTFFSLSPNYISSRSQNN
jgi:hypothetical protein